jgi:hypothetical protein
LVEKVVVNERGSVEHLKCGTDAHHGLRRLGALRVILSETRGVKASNPSPVAKQRSESLSAGKKVFGVINEDAQVG